MVVALEFKRDVCEDLCKAVRKVNLKGLMEVATRKKNLDGVRVKQVWRAPDGNGFKAAAIQFTKDAEDILVIAFRNTFGNDEWRQYDQTWGDHKFSPHDGQSPGTDYKVYTVWNSTVDEVSDHVKNSVLPTRLPSLSPCWSQLIELYYY